MLLRVEVRCDVERHSRDGSSHHGSHSHPVSPCVFVVRAAMASSTTGGVWICMMMFSRLASGPGGRVCAACAVHHCHPVDVDAASGGRCAGTGRAAFAAKLAAGLPRDIRAANFVRRVVCSRALRCVIAVVHRRRVARTRGSTHNNVASRSAAVGCIWCPQRVDPTVDGIVPPLLDTTTCTTSPRAAARRSAGCQKWKFSRSPTR